MFQIAYNYQDDWQENQSQRIEGHFAQDIKISPALAKRKANGFLAGYVTMMVPAGQPVLHLGDTPFWQIPIQLNLPQKEQVDILGFVSLNAQTGDLNPLTDTEITQIQDLAHAIAKHFKV